MATLKSPAGEINRLRIDLDARHRFVLSDRAQLTSALLNLVANARDAMPAGGEIRIGSSLQGDTDGRQFLRLRVGDCGSGMSEEVKSHMFEPFFTTRETGQGTEVALLLPLAEDGRTSFRCCASRIRGGSWRGFWVEPGRATHFGKTGRGC